MNNNNSYNLYNAGIDMAHYQLLSPSGSATEASKNTILHRPIKTESLTPSLLPPQNMTGPSFDYSSYQQHTGLVTGAVAHTYAINQSLLDDNTFLSSDSGMDFDFNSPLIPQTSSFGSPTTFAMDATDSSPVRQTIDPSNLQSNMRVYTGFHKNQAAAAAEASKIKIEAQQIQQQQIMQQQQQRHAAQSAKKSDPLLDAKISQVLNSFREQQSSNMNRQSPDSPDDGNRSQSKDLDDMDEDERLLNSEEGKKLSPKERRQLRNKVSARHFRKRRKEMIVDLEVVNQNLSREVDTLKMEKDKLLADYENMKSFVEHIISTPNFAGYMQTMQDQVLGLNQQTSPQSATQSRQRQRSQQQFSMPMVPEQTLQFADVINEDALFPADSPNDMGNMPMLSAQYSNESSMFGENTQIFAVLDTPQPSIDIATLSGKTTNFVGQQEEFVSQEDKVELAPLEKGPATIAQPPTAEKAETSSVVDEDFDNDPAFALYHLTPESSKLADEDKPVELDTDGLSHVDIFGGIELEKVFERYELVDASEEEVGAALAMERVRRISTTVEDVMARLELMTIDL